MTLDFNDFSRLPKVRRRFPPRGSVARTFAIFVAAARFPRFRISIGFPVRPTIGAEGEKRAVERDANPFRLGGGSPAARRSSGALLRSTVTLTAPQASGSLLSYFSPCLLFSFSSFSPPFIRNLLSFDRSPALARSRATFGSSRFILSPAAPFLDSDRVDFGSAFPREPPRARGARADGAGALAKTSRLLDNRAIRIGRGSMIPPETGPIDGIRRCSPKLPSPLVKGSARPRAEGPQLCLRFIPTNQSSKIRSRRIAVVVERVIYSEQSLGHFLEPPVT